MIVAKTVVATIDILLALLIIWGAKDNQKMELGTAVVAVLNILAIWL